LPGWPAPAWFAAVAAVAVALAAVTLAGWPLTVAAWLIGGGILLVVTLYAPAVALFVLPLAVAFGSLLPLDVHGLHAGPTDLLLGGLVLAYLVRAAPRATGWLGVTAAGHKTTGPRSRFAVAGASLAAPVRRLARCEPFRLAVFAALLAYLLVVALSLLVATSRVATLKEVIKWSEVTVVVALGLWLLRSPRQVHVLVWGLIVAGVAEALTGYGQWVLASGALGTNGGDIRVFGTFAQPNPYAGYLNFALPLAVALVLFGTDARERWVAGAASVLILGAEVLAGSRGGLLGIVAAALVLVVVGWRRARLAALAALIGAPVLLVAWVAHVIPTRVQNALLAQFRVGGVSVCGDVTSANFSTVERVAHWVAGLRMFQAHPLLGVGAGNYDAAYARYACADWPESLGHAHNYYINAAAETGILGLLAFLALVAVALALGWRATHPRTSTLTSETALADDTWAGAPTRALALGLFAVVAALTIHNLTDDLFVHGMELQFALCLACLLRLLGPPNARH